ncbi:sulfotransferase family protein [Pseudoscourfieldia marina]
MSFVSDEHKFIFVHLPKSGGTTVTEYLLEHLCPASKLSKTKVMNSYRLGPHVSVPVNCKYGAKQSYGESDLQKKWKRYFVFTFVRSPVARLVSAYNYVNWVISTKHFKSKREYIHPPFNNFCVNPVESVLGGMVRRLRSKERAIKRIVIDHVRPQSGCLLGSDGQLAVDYIGNVDNIKYGLEETFNKINRISSTKGARIFKLDRTIVKRNSISHARMPALRTTNALSRISPACCEAFWKRYASDIEIFHQFNFTIEEGLCSNPQLRQ